VFTSNSQHRALTTTRVDLGRDDHIRGRKATLELAAQMNLNTDSHVLDIGSGLGGPARTLAETGKRVSFKQGDATNLPFDEGKFDAAMTIHVAMNIAAKDKMYMEAHRVVKPGGIFAVYDILQDEGGEVLYPVPWARDPSISHLATLDEMKSLLVGAGFTLRDVQDSTEESQSFFSKG
jgi:ubiquinone/menaquinone biosynthesis C-methylase UbiE